MTNMKKYAIVTVILLIKGYHKESVKKKIIIKDICYTQVVKFFI